MHCTGIVNRMGPHPSECHEWARADPEQMKRVARATDVLERRRRLAETYSDIGLRFVAPVNSDDEKWEAHWLPDGHVWADTYTEMCQQVREKLGIVVPE
jgi:hypothetical protein